MKNTFGNALSVTIFGESHGAGIGAVLDGMTPGIKVDEENIRHFLSLRRPSGNISTSRREDDEFKILSGVFNGYTTGTPITVIIENKNTNSSHYDKNILRPSHADFTAQCKYKGYQDYRGGGHFSGRVTAALVAVGAIAWSALKDKGVLIGSHISKCGGICDNNFENINEDIEKLMSTNFPVLSEEAAMKMKQKMESVAAEGDSIGGVLETVVSGMPAGVGEPWFDSLESMLSHIMFSIPAVKGIEFGDGFLFAEKQGSCANDSFRVENGEVVTATNNNGGINGGISNGMPIIFRTVIKPTPSIFKSQETVDIEKMENVTLNLKGRHDPAIIHRAAIVQTSCTALCILDAFLQGMKGN